MLYSTLPQAAQNMYLQVYEGAYLRTLSRGVGALNGSFAKKKVRDLDYWYFQYTGANGKLMQFFVGPDSDVLRNLITSKKEALGPAHLRKLTDAAIGLGCRAITNEHFKVLQPLEQHGLFAAGGILVGTHAFIAYGNSLGIEWKGQLGTEDSDFAHAGRSVSLALPSTFELNTNEVVRSLEMGFLPASTFGKVFGGAYVHPKQPEFRLDFLTPKTSVQDDPVYIPQLGIAMQPLAFLHYSLEEVQQAVLLSTLGPVLVSVPHPARYAAHKLLIAGERQGAYQAKASKDIDQAAALIEWYLDHKPVEYLERESLLCKQGKGWEKRYNLGIRGLANRYANLEARLEHERDAWRHAVSGGSDDQGEGLAPL